MGPDLPPVNCEAILLCIVVRSCVASGRTGGAGSPKNSVPKIRKFIIALIMWSQIKPLSQTFQTIWLIHRNSTRIIINNQTKQWDSVTSIRRSTQLSAGGH